LPASAGRFGDLAFYEGNLVIKVGGDEITWWDFMHPEDAEAADSN
jgi:hypothetical protein